ADGAGGAGARLSWAEAARVRPGQARSAASRMTVLRRSVRISHVSGRRADQPNERPRGKRDRDGQDDERDDQCDGGDAQYHLVDSLEPIRDPRLRSPGRQGGAALENERADLAPGPPG